MGPSSGGDSELQTRIRQQEVVAELGQRALESDDLDRLMREASEAVAETLDTEYCSVLELLPGRDEARLRQGVGWPDGPIGEATVSAGRSSLVGFTLDSREPIIVDDLREETRFSGSDLLRDHDVVTGISVVVGSAADPWGVLGTHTTDRREFTDDDAHFVQSVANVLASAIENLRTRSELEEMYDRISDAFFALDEDWNFAHLNERADDLINPDGRELVGQNVWEEFPDALGRAFREKYERAMYEQETVSFEEYYPEPLDAWFEVRAYPSETGLSVYFRDVTDRKERNRELEEKERRFEAIFEDPNILVGLLEPDGTVLDINETAMEYVDADLADVTGEPFWETPWWGEGDGVKDDVREWTERAAAGEYVDFEADLTRPDGQRYTLNGAFRPVTDEEGEVVSIIVSDRDVTERRAYERRLAESERPYRTLAECFPNGIVTLFGDDLRYTLAAGRAFDYLPVSPDELENRTPREVWGDDVADDLEPVLRDALDGEERSVEVRYADREWVIRAVPITDEAGDVFAGMTMAQDITEQKDRERFLEDAKAQLEAATEAGAVGTWEWKIPEDRFIAGASFASKFGVDPEAAREGVPLDRFVDAIHEADRDRVEAAIESAVETCGEYETEYRVRNADGEVRWVVARGHVECDAEGQPITFPGALTDITERKRAELRLQETKRELETLFEVLPVGVAVADETGAFVEVNDAADELWGGALFDAGSLDEYAGDTGRWADTGEPIEPDEWAMARVLRGEELTDPDVYEIEAAAGTRRIVLAHGMPVLDADGEVARGVITLTDITERRDYQRRLEETVERLEASNERLEQFAYAASHDLQEPLRMVSSYLQLIESRYGDALEEDGEEFLEFAVEGAERMRDMIDGLLAYSRVDAGGSPLESVDLETVFADVRTDLQVRIDEEDAEITTEALPRVRGDAGQLRQVFQNLLDNAIEYRGDEPPRVHVSAERAGGEWTISVRDEGIGIDPDDTDDVFEVYQRLHTPDEYSGTGIGLALVERIVERHGGDIWVDSEPGEGATFSFTLPAADGS